MMNCKHVTELYTDHKDGKLSRFEGLRFRFHLRICPFCSAYARQMEHTIDALKALDASTSENTTDSALAQFRAWKKKTPL